MSKQPQPQTEKYVTACIWTARLAERYDDWLETTPCHVRPNVPGPDDVPDDVPYEKRVLEKVRDMVEHVPTPVLKDIKLELEGDYATYLSCAVLYDKCGPQVKPALALEMKADGMNVDTLQEDMERMKVSLWYLRRLIRIRKNGTADL